MPELVTAADEAAFDRKAEKHFRLHHRGLPESGERRDYRSFIQHAITRDERKAYRDNFDAVFPDAPGCGI